MAEFQISNQSKFGITVFNKAEQKSPSLHAMENPLFSTKNFKMPEKGLDGNPFGGKYIN